MYKATFFTRSLLISLQQPIHSL